MLLNVNQSYSVVFFISGHLVLSWGRMLMVTEGCGQ